MLTHSVAMRPSTGTAFSPRRRPTAVRGSSTRSIILPPWGRSALSTIVAAPAELFPHEGAGVSPYAPMGESPRRDDGAHYTVGLARTLGATFLLIHLPSEELPSSLPSSTMTLPRRMVITG